MIFAAIATVATISAIVGYSVRKEQSGLSALALANIEALSDIQEIGGKWYVIDEIPCASSAIEYRVDYSYVNCSDCKSQSGKAKEENGTCTTIRPFER